MKLKEWADKQGISYLTAWRWFKAGDPRLAKAYQSDSGTIIVPDENESSELAMVGSTQNDAMSLFLKKTVEFSKNNSSVEDFAAYVISNFSLKLNSVSESPRYSKQKPKSEEIQKHFKQFLPDEEKREHLKAVKTLIKEQGVEPFPADTLSKIEMTEPPPFTRVNDPSNDMTHEFSELLSEASTVSGVRLYDDGNTTEGLVNRSVDLNTTPQQINYTGSTNQAFSSSFATNAVVTSSVMPAAAAASLSLADARGGSSLGGGTFFMNAAPSVAFQPTQKEIQSAAQVAEEIAETDELPRKRGRKPTKKR